METLFITLAIIYLAVAFIAFVIQAFTRGMEGDQSNSASWKTILENSFSWPYLVFKLVIRR